MKKRLLVAIGSLLALAALALPGPALDVRAGLFDSPPPGGPENDHFANAFVIGEPPFSHSVDLSTASLEEGEPTPSCVGDSWGQSVWYAYTPAQSGWISAHSNDWYSTVAAHTGDSLSTLSEVGSRCWAERLTFWAEAGTTYYFQMGAMYGYGGEWMFYLEGPPPNDDFVDAISISGLPYSQYLDTSVASVEPGEPTPSCVGWETWGRSAWYAYTPAQSGSVMTRTDAWSSTVAAYTGDSLNSLSEVGSHCWGGEFTFAVEADKTYYLQIGGMYDYDDSFTFYLDVAPPPEAAFWFNPYDPSVFDTIWFDNYSWDPGNAGFESAVWDLGDGTTSTDWSLTHQYAVDGEYTVRLEVITYDGRSASTSQVVQVRTRDVAITKFLAPSAAKAGQTRSITVGVNSKRYPERVRVELQKSVPGGYEWVGSLVQSVPVRPANRTTDFSFKYTFTADDARIGKVTFRATAYLEDGRDALPADNEAIAAPTKVTQ